MFCADYVLTFMYVPSLTKFALTTVEKCIFSGYCSYIHYTLVCPFVRVHEKLCMPYQTQSLRKDLRDHRHRSPSARKDMRGGVCMVISIGKSSLVPDRFRRAFQVPGLQSFRLNLHLVHTSTLTLWLETSSEVMLCRKHPCISCLRDNPHDSYFALACQPQPDKLSWNQ